MNYWNTLQKNKSYNQLEGISGNIRKLKKLENLEMSPVGRGIWQEN